MNNWLPYKVRAVKMNLVEVRRSFKVLQWFVLTNSIFMLSKKMQSVRTLVVSF